MIASTAIVFETEIGWIGIRMAAGLIERCVIGHETQGLALQNLQESRGQPHELRTSTAMHDSRQRKVVDLLTAYCSGQPTCLQGLEINRTWMTPFQNKVVQACQEIPWGETRSYGELARQAGSSGASRAVGTVMASNRFPLIVPCHRVLASNGPGGFSAPNGLNLKQRLLANERTLQLFDGLESSNASGKIGSGETGNTSTA